MEEKKIRYKKVIETLKLLSLPYQKQKEYFPDFVDVPFEVLNTFQNSFLLLPELVEAKFFTLSAISNLLRLSNLINFAINSADLENLSDVQLDSNNEWNTIRDLSKKTLKIIGEPLVVPNKEFI